MVLIVLIALSGVDLRAETENGSGVVEWTARVFSPELRRTEARLETLAGELESLPKLQETPLASRYGFRSNTLLEQNRPHWVQIDLGLSWPIDRIVAVPAHISDLGAKGVGYGFPLRFKVEVSDDVNMKGAVTVTDRTTEDVANPGRFPMVFKMPPTQGRYVRFTSTRHYPIEKGFIWALEELIVLSGNNTVSVNQAVTTSSSLALFPHWSKGRLNDGQSALGMPVTAEKSPSHGYQSAETKDPKEFKWLVVDLGRDYLIDEIRLLPVESRRFETLGLQSFARAWTVELADDPGFTEVIWRHQRDSTNVVGFPGECAIILSERFSHPGRYLRFSTQTLWGSKGRASFALAEVQAYAAGENVALGKSVTAKDADKTDSAAWAPGFVTDGFSSQYRLIEYPEYLDLIKQRGELEEEQGHLLARREDKVRMTGLVLGYGGSSVGAVAVFGWGFLLLRRKTIQVRAMTQLRDQIARDLHDDIGSSLGGIVLLSEMGSLKGADAETREDFKTIKDSAEETAKSMQDIVWLIQRGNTNLRDLVTRMRQSADAILGDEVVSLAIEPSDFRDRQLSLLFRRHVLFAFKEALNNVRRHAEATAVEVNINIDRHDLSFEIRDNGRGFDPQHLSELGHGLTNLQRRAERLAGSCLIESSPEHGTRVFFKALLNSKSK